jgi:hypothetical protein
MDDYAKESGVTRSDVLRDWLSIAEEVVRERGGMPAGRFDQLLGALEAVRLLLHIIGPASLGTRRLLAHWATRDSSLRVSEDELLAEVRLVSDEEWEEAVSSAEESLPDAPAPTGEPRER